MDVVHVVGLGAGGNGMRLITNRELPDSEFSLLLDLGDDGAALSLKGRAVWHEEWNFEFVHRHVAGVELHGLTTEDAARIDAVIQSREATPDEYIEAP